MITVMSRGDGHTRQAVSSLDSGIHFEPLEPRLLLSGTTEGVVAEVRLPDDYQTDQSVVEAQEFTFADEENSAASENLCILEQDPSSLPDLSDDSDESSLSADEGDPSINLGIFSNEMPTFDLLEDASKDTELETFSYIDETGSAVPIEDPTSSEAVSLTAAMNDTDTDGETLVGLDETGIMDTTDVTAILTDPETADPGTLFTEGDAETENLLSSEDISSDSALTLPEEESEILSDSALLSTNAASESDTADEGIGNELVFVNDDVADYDQLTEDLLTMVPDDRDITVVMLDSEQNGIEQISSVLSESENIDAVHFVTHGTDHSVQLGDTWLQDNDLDTYSDEISGWGGSLTGDADLVFYGCNLAGGDRGRELLDSIADLTDADVAASTDNTGYAIYGADWDLEYSAGSIETSVVFSDQIQENWMGLLAGETVDSLWISTLNDVTSGGSPGIDTWEDGEAIELGDPNLTLGTATDGTFSSILDLDDFAASDARINAIHYVTNDITVGSAASIDLLAGDVLLSTTDDETIGGTAFNDEDVFVFRPDTVGDYSSGTSFMLIDGSDIGLGGAGEQLNGVTLIEQDTVVAGTTFDAGTFLLSSTDGFADIRHYDFTSVGTTTAGSDSTFLDLSDIDIDDNSVDGLDLVETDMEVGGVSLTSGQLLVYSFDDADAGDNALAKTNHDIFILDITSTGTTSAATATMFFDGSDVSLDTTAEELTALSLVFINDAPTVTPTGADLAYTEDDGAVAVDDAIAVADVDDTNLESATVQITGNYLDTEDQLGFENQNGITGIWDVGTGTLTLSGTSSVANYQTALQSITYTNRDNATPDTTTRTVTFTVNDGDTDSVAATRDITVAALTDITARETIDSDGDGQIDQIKITTDQNLDDDFSGLTITVDGYGVAGYSSDIANDNVFYVDLTESGTGDTGATPTVTVTANTTLSEDGGSNNIATDDTVAWWDADWQNRTRITFDNTNSAEDLDDFPVLVSLTDSDVDFDKIKADGADIRFVDNGGTALNYQIEDWDDGAETAKVWVKVQQLDSSSNTDYIHMYYNNTDASDAQNAAGVWDSNHDGVWHMGDGTSTDTVVSNNNTITILDDAQADTYPSTINVSGLTGTVTNVTVTITDLSHTYPDDLDILLVGPQGQTVMLMSDQGGGQNETDIDLTFDDDAASDLPDGDGIVTGTYRPLDDEQSDSMDAPAPAGPYGTALSTFDGEDPNGDWKLYIMDDMGNDTGSISGGWSLTITTCADIADSVDSYDGTNYGSTSTTGKVADAQEFDGTDDYIDFTSTDFGDTFTIEAWIKPDSTGAGIQTIAANSSSGATTDGFRFFIKDDGQIVFETGNGAASAGVLTAVGEIDFDQWNHIAVEVDRAGGSGTIYHNGVDATVGGGTRTDFNTVSEWEIGRMEGSFEFKGTIDEFRMATAARSADWIEASYLSQNGTFAFTSFGSEQVTTTDTAAPVLLSAIGTDRGTDGLFNSVGDQLDLVFSEAIQAVPGEADSETNFVLSGVDGDNFPTEVGGDTIIELATTTVANDTIRYTFSAGDTANANLITAGTGTIDVNIGGLVADSIEDAAGNDLVDTATGSPLTISATNVAPVLDNTGTMTLTDVVEDDTDPAGDTVADIIDSAAGDRITDLDGGAVEGIAVIGVDNTNGTWQYDTGGGWTAFGALTAANNSAVLLNPTASIRFVPGADYNGSAGDITFRAWDQTSGSNGDTGVDVSTNGTTTAYSTDTETATLTVTVDNDAPTVTPTVADLDYIENDGAVILDGSITVADADNTNLKGAVIQITGNYQDGEDTLAFVDQNGITGVWDDGAGTLTLTGTTTTTNYQTALQSITYTNGSEDPDTGDRTVTFTVTDEDDLDSAAGTRDITVAAVNDAPIFSTTIENPTFAEGSAPSVLYSATSINLVEAGDLVDTLTMTFAGLENGADEILSVDGTDVALTHGTNVVTGATYVVDVSVAGDTATVTITKAGGFTAAAAETLVDGLAYQNTSADPTGATRTATLTLIQDNGGTANGGDDDTVLSAASQSPLDIVGVNDAPVLSATADNPTFTEGGAAAGLYSSTDINLVEAADSVDTLTMTVAGLQNGADEILRVDGTDVALTDGTNVVTGATYVVDVSVAGDTATVTITKAGGFTAAAAETLIDGLAYENTSDDPLGADRTVTLTYIKDNGGTAGGGDDDTILSVATTVTLTADNDAPVADDGTLSVAEDASNGAVVGTAAASDPDTGDTLTYSITAGNDDGIFTIDNSTGKITVTDNSNLNYESTTSYSLTVQVEDVEGLKDTSTITVNVTNANESPIATDATMSVAEDASNGAVVGTVTASDPDAGDTKTYSITAGNGDGIFAIDSSTGEITVTDNSNLNYESATSYSLTVQVEDAGGLTDTAAVTVNITNVNESPTADDETFSVDEDASNGAVVGTVTTADPDAGDTLTYSITAGNGDGIFAINSATGKITVTDNSNLDYESTTSYGLTVKVEDAGGLTDTAAITVNVTNVNEDPTVNSASFSIDEHSADGSAIGTITASDPDAGDSLTYSIIAGNDQGLFSINSATGKLTINNGIDLDFEVSPTHTLTIRVSDSGSPMLSKTATVTINLNDVFEAAAAEADPEPDPKEPEEAEPEDTTSDTEPEPVDDTGTDNDQTEGDLSGTAIDDEDPTDNDTDQEDDTEPEEETDSENQTEGLPQNLPSDSRDGSNAVTRKKHNPDKRDGKAKTSVKNRKESKQAAEQKPEEMLLMNPQGRSASNRGVDLSSDAPEFSAIGSGEKISAPAKAIITNRTMQRELDSINEQINEAAKRMESRGKLIAGTAMGVSAALMGGYALWAFRGISLMASSFASLPVWQFFDPLPVLSDWEGNSDTGSLGGKNDEDIIDEDEKRLRTIFDK